MDMSRFNQPPREETDLKAKDFVGKHLELVIREAGSVTYPGKNGQADQEKSFIYFEGKEKRVILSGENNQVLCDAYGEQDAGWRGKRISLTTKDYSKEGFPPGWIVAALDAEMDDDIPF